VFCAAPLYQLCGRQARRPPELVSLPLTRVSSVGLPRHGKTGVRMQVRSMTH